jgi:maltose alpha-D-glucosyltransferase/alpha-amylase
MRRLIRVRKSTRVFSRGSFAFLRPPNHRVLAYVRALGEEHVLVVHNLSNTAQSAELDLHDLAGTIPVAVVGGSLFPGARPTC